jgi:ATP-dependent helicase/nuclease subunit A
VTATQLKGRALDEEIAENAANAPYIRPLTQPKFRQESKGLTAAERGTATHLVLQYLDFADMDVVGQIKRLRQRELLTEEQAKAVHVSALERFLQSPLAKEICAGGNVLREYRFTLLMDAQVYDPEAPEGDSIMLQGVVDCALLEPDGITIVDFKTDYVTHDTVSVVAERYAPQVQTYADALERIYVQQIKKTLLYFFAMDTFVEV